MTTTLSSTASFHPPVRSASAIRPLTTPIATCATNIRDLAPNAKTLHRAMLDTRRQILRMDIPERDSLKAEWTARIDLYKNILDGTNAAANQLAGVIDVYLALQNNTNEGQEENMIKELSALRANLERTDFRFNVQCASLKENIDAFHRRLADPASNEQANQLSASANKHDSDTNVTHLETSALSSTNSQQQPVAVRQEVTTNFSTRSAWSRLCELVSPAAAPVSAPASASGGAPIRTEEMVVDHIKRLNEGASVRIQRQRSGGTPSTDHGVPSEPVDPPFLSAVKETSRRLDLQTRQFEAFSEIAQHLKNEINAYTQAFQAAKAYPTREKRIALENMHNRVVASSAHWRECAAALTDGYARIQK
ncbi:hypothetical protein OH77DRAFT_1588731 [Trametes cingulata]|nr:hypothetical protein OH77DRAFT_1588731 [Trametes cingulata]